MKIVAINPTGVSSGAERVLIRYVVAAAGRGWHAMVASPPGPLSSQIEQHGIEHVRLPELRLGEGPRPLSVARLGANNLRAAADLRRICADADVVLANSVLALPSIRLAKIQTPVCWLVHDVITRPDLVRTAAWASTAVDVAVGVSEAAAGLARRLGMEVKVVRNGVSSLGATEWRPQSGLIGLNAVLTPWKGQDVALEAIALLPDDVHIELLGGAMPKDADYEQRLRRRAEQPDLAGRVEFLGHRDDVASVMSRWQVALSASVEPEAGPLAVLEAMSLGVPLVATDHGGAPEVMGDIGLVVQPGDPVELAAAIGRFMAEPDRWRDASIRGSRRVAERYLGSDAENDILAVLQQMAEGGVRAEVHD